MTHQCYWVRCRLFSGGLPFAVTKGRTIPANAWFGHDLQESPFASYHPYGAGKPGNDLFDAVDIHQERPVSPPKEIGIEAIEKLFQCAAVRVALGAVRA